MSGFCIRNDRQGWRAVDSENDCLENEHFSETSLSEITPSKSQRLAILDAAFEADQKKLIDAYTIAVISNGNGEEDRKSFIKDQLAALDSQYQLDQLSIIME